MINKLQNICEECGNAYSIRDSWEAKKRKYCSSQCVWNHKKGKPNLSCSKKVIYYCKLCGKEIIDSPSHKRIFCSSEHSSQWRREHIHPYNIELKRETITCKNCGKIVELVPWKAKIRQFCSHKCFMDWARGENGSNYKGTILTTCTFCGKNMKEYPYRKDRIHFCSKECFKQWEKMSGLWLSEGFAKKVWIGWNKTPNKKERILIDLIRENELPFKFVGNGEVIIDGKCPDFISDDGNKIIELYGDYWHRDDNPSERIDFFNERGKDCLVIWERELKNENEVLQRIDNYIGGEI